MRSIKLYLVEEQKLQDLKRGPLGLGNGNTAFIVTLNGAHITDCCGVIRFKPTFIECGVCLEIT